MHLILHAVEPTRRWRIQKEKLARLRRSGRLPALVTVLSLSVTPLQTRLFIARALARRLLALERSLGALSELVKYKCSSH